MKGSRVSLHQTLLLIGASILPVYAFGSGGVQPTHAILSLFSILTLITRRETFQTWALMLLALSFYSFFIESFYIFLGGDTRFLINSVFLLYNLVLAHSLYWHVRKEGLASLAIGIVISAMIALITILISGVNLHELDQTGRATGTFNNPNQLGYFSVCLLSLSYLFYRSSVITYWIATSLFAVSLFLAIASLSKAAILANLFVMALALKPVSRNGYIFWILGAFIVSGSILYLFGIGAFDEYLFMQRIVNISNESDSSPSARGYFAFLEGNTSQVFFGLGEQNVREIVGHEVHSTFGSVLNNYGFLGFSIFLSVFIFWAVSIKKNFGLIGLACLVGPPFLYGLTHNGVRFTIFWLLFAASLGMSHKNRKKNPKHFIPFDDRHYGTTS